MSAYYASSGGPAVATGPEELAPVLVWFAGPAPQSRLTVLVRLLMVIPHLVVLWALAIAAYVIVIIGWFGALFTGRLPVFAADFLTGFVRWQTRVFGYAILLTDVYPPFTLEDVDYPIRVAVRPGRLNRLAVLFRFFLLIPAWLVASVLGYGAFTLFQLVNWLIVLIRGRMPYSLHQALAATLRYQARVLGFAFMLTSAYPSGLYGDPAPQGWVIQQPPWWVVLSSGAKALLTTFTVLGVLLVAGEVAVETVVASHAATAAEASSQLQADLDPLNSVLSNYSAQVQACQSQSCVTIHNLMAAAAFDTFAAQVRAIPMPSGPTSAEAANLAAAAAHEGNIYHALAAATTQSRYQSVASGLQQAHDQVQQDYTTLINDLAAS